MRRRKQDRSFGVSPAPFQREETYSSSLVLDPVMGDEGRLYVNEDVVPFYRRLLRDADLVLPNQFELEYG